MLIKDGTLPPLQHGGRVPRDEGLAPDEKAYNQRVGEYFVKSFAAKTG